MGGRGKVALPLNTQIVAIDSAEVMNNLQKGLDERGCRVVRASYPLNVQIVAIDSAWVINNL